jgi:trehalose synthase
VLRLVDTAVQEIAPYVEFMPGDRLAHIRDLARELEGRRILHLNATAYGGGVAELLNSLVPLERGLGLDVSWGVIVAEAPFFNLTKRLHNALQGDPSFHADPDEAEAYLHHNAMVANVIDDEFDVVIVHDPQPAPTRHLCRSVRTKWIWRVHLDLSAYNTQAWEFLDPYVRDYDAFVFTMSQFVPKPLDREGVYCFAPAIDPLTPKNLVLPGEIVDRIVRWLGVHLDRPLLTQVSRFDPWKDPLGVVRVFREVRERHPGLQLALLGSMALDDPEGWTIYEQIRADIGDDPDIHLASNFNGIGNIEVNAFQRRSDVVIQKSIREGFGLVVSETVWKGTPIVAGNTGGIPLQIQDGRGGYLVSREPDWARRIDELLAQPQEASRIGELGREHVREHYLMPRLLEDELRLMAALTRANGAT